MDICTLRTTWNRKAVLFKICYREEYEDFILRNAKISHPMCLLIIIDKWSCQSAENSACNFIIKGTFVVTINEVPLEVLSLLRPFVRITTYFPWERLCMSSSIFNFPVNSQFCCCYWACQVNGYISLVVLLINNCFHMQSVKTIRLYRNEDENRTKNPLINLNGDLLVPKRSCQRLLSRRSTGPAVACIDYAQPKIPGPPKRQCPSVCDNNSVNCTEKTCFVILLLFLTNLFGTTLAAVGCASANTFSNESRLRECVKDSLVEVSLSCNQYSLDNLLTWNETSSCTISRSHLEAEYVIDDVVKIEMDTGHITETTGPFSRCCVALNRVKCVDSRVQQYMETFVATIMKYSTPKLYSRQWALNDCAIAYKNWICSEVHKVYNGTTKIMKPCPSMCLAAEKACPFFRVHNNTKLYGGQPGFLCQGFQGSSLKEESCYTVEGNSIIKIREP